MIICIHKSFHGIYFQGDISKPGLRGQAGETGGKVLNDRFISTQTKLNLFDHLGLFGTAVIHTELKKKAARSNLISHGRL
jgi:hypothetical protein